MRATMRITCLLLSLSLLGIHIVSSNGDVQTAPSVTKNTASATPGPSAVPTGGSSSRTEPTTDRKATVGGTTVAPPTDDASKKNEPTQTPTPAKTTAAITTPDPKHITMTITPKPTDKPAPTQPQAPTVTKKTPAPPTVTSSPLPTVRIDATSAVATPSPSKTPTPAATADSSGGSVASSNAATLQTPIAPVPSKTSGTEAPVRLPGNVGTTRITKVSTDASTPGQQSMTQPIIITTKTSQGSKGGTEETTVKVTIHLQTASKSPDQAGNTGTTSIPSATTKAGPPAAETSGTKAGPHPVSPQTNTTTTTTIKTTTIAAQPKTFLYSLNKGHEKEEEKDLVEVCRRLMVNLQDGNCTLTWQHHNGKIQFDCVEINGKVKTSLATQYYEEITKKPTDNKTLIAILASCGALLIMIVILAVCASHHRKPYNENQQHLTEELHTVENGYHDNPTLEVMEVQPEMQEKKVALNGEFNDSWIVPIDNLLKEDIPDEEDTHL